MTTNIKNNSVERAVRVGFNDSVYPISVKNIMGSKAPNYLYMMGNTGLLNLPGIGFCGCRKSSSKGLDAAKDCAEQAAENNFTVVSGNAAGVDFQAHFSALKAGGKAIFVLPEGINHFRVKRGLKPIWDWENVLVVSQFEFDAPWSVFRAMERNQLIIALSRVMVVIEAGEKGGTFNAGEATLKTNMPLFVAEYQDMSVEARGNKVLLARGAQKLGRSPATKRANLARVFAQMKNGATTESFQKQVAFPI